MANINSFINRIICGDCLEVMKDMPDESIDLVVTDPPYNIGKAVWDKIDNYLEWCGEWITQCERVLKDNGSFYFSHNDTEVMFEIGIWIKRNTAFRLKNILVWNKRFEGMSNKGFMDGCVVTNGLRNYQQMAEYLLFYTFQEKTGLAQVYDNRDCFRGIKEYLRVERKKAGLSNNAVNRICEVKNTASRHFFGDSQWCLPTAEMYAKLQTTGFFQRPYEELRLEYEELRLEYEELRYTFNNQKTHHSVWNYETVRNAYHPTQKPEPLIANIIKHSSNEGDIVLDPFCGSGTTPVVADRLKRRYIVIDNEPKYIKIAEQRIADIQAQPELPNWRTRKD